MNAKNYFTWHEFWYPNQAAAQNIADKLNLWTLEYNAKQDELEAGTSVELTKLDNIKIIVAIIIITVALVFINQ